MKKNSDKRSSPIAVIGMGCMFPNSPDLKQFWRLLFQGEDAIDKIPETHWSLDDYYDADPKRPDHVYCSRGGFLPPVPFDPTEFGIPPAILEATDSSQLLGLVAAKMALEDAGYGSDRDFERERASVILGLTGTQKGCGIGDCGTCTVLVDGVATFSCLTLAIQVEGCSIETVEGLAKNGKLNRLQQSFVDHGAIQCGYCTPGMLMTTTELLRRNPHPGEHEIRRAISGNLCRCTGYDKIVRAIMKVAGSNSLKTEG